MKDVSGSFDDWSEGWRLLTCGGDSYCSRKRALSAAAADDDNLLCEESVGEVWLSCVLELLSVW